MKSQTDIDYNDFHQSVAHSSLIKRPQLTTNFTLHGKVAVFITTLQKQRKINNNRLTQRANVSSSNLSLHVLTTDVCVCMQEKHFTQ